MRCCCGARGDEKKLQERKGLAATRLQCVFRGRADRLTFYALRAAGGRGGGAGGGGGFDSDG